MHDARSPLDHALSDGEDFELVFAVAPAEDPDHIRIEGFARLARNNFHGFVDGHGAPVLPIAGQRVQAVYR